MSALLRPISRVMLLACFANAITPAATPVASTPGADGRQPSANSMPEVRLRKLHLVRPDLIPYPIAYEVYC